MKPAVAVITQSRLPTSLESLRYKFDSVFDIGSAIWYRNTSDESSIAVNPLNKNNLIVVSHQDRFVNFLADVIYYSMDGGETWNQSNIILSRNQGPVINAASNDYESASDPSVIFDNYGNAYMTSVSFDAVNDFNEAVVMIKSTDGGATWNTPISIQQDDGTEHYQDRQLLSFNPYQKGVLYCTWTDYQGILGGRADESFVQTNSLINTLTKKRVMFKNKSIKKLADTPVYNNIKLQISKDGGNSWTGPVDIADFPPPTVPVGVDVSDYGPWNNTVWVLPNYNHRLILTTFVSSGGIANPGPNTPKGTVYCLTSDDEGQIWVKHIVADNITLQPTFDLVTNRLVMGNSFLAVSAVNDENGYIYVAWADPRFSAPGKSGIALSMSKDGGITWSNPVNPNPNHTDVSTFLPAITVLKNNCVAISYYDFRNFNNGANSWCDVWLGIYDENLKYKLLEYRLTDTSFDVLQAMVRSGFDSLFLGDYTGLTHYHNTVHASYCITNPPFDVPPVAYPPCGFVKDSRGNTPDDTVLFPNRQSVNYMQVHITTEAIKENKDNWIRLKHKCHDK